jgi:DNA-binding MarR family transcriptional regulator
VPERSPFRHEQADDSPGFLLWKVTALWQARIAVTLGPLGLTQTQYAILASLRWFEECGERPTQRHLVEHARLDKMTLSKAIRKLEDAGLVSRHACRHDGRATEVRFTARGRRTVEKAVVSVEEADDLFFAALNDRRLREWLALTREVIAHNAPPSASSGKSGG